MNFSILIQMDTFKQYNMTKLNSQYCFLNFVCLFFTSLNVSTDLSHIIMESLHFILLLNIADQIISFSLPFSWCVMSFQNEHQFFVQWPGGPYFISDYLNTKDHVKNYFYQVYFILKNRIEYRNNERKSVKLIIIIKITCCTQSVLQNFDPENSKSPK